MADVPDRGDIIHLQFDPASGVEMKGPHLRLVVSSKLFNQQGLAMVCPISQGAAGASCRYAGGKPNGVRIRYPRGIHCHQLKALGWRVRKAKRKEGVSVTLMIEVIARLSAILFD